MAGEPEWIVEVIGRKNAGQYGYNTSDWCVKERGSMRGEVICIVPNGVTDVEDPKPGSLELAKRICKLLKLEALAKELSLCLEEGDDRGGQTHYTRDGQVFAKGSFIALVEKARELAGE